MRKKSTLYKILMPFIILAAVISVIAGLTRLPAGKQENPYFMPGDARFSWEPGDRWTLGFAKQNLTESPEVRENAEKSGGGE